MTLAALLLATLAVSAPPAAPDEKARQYWREYCSLLDRCGLGLPAVCTPALRGGEPGVTYDDARCALPRALAARGFTPVSPHATRVYRFLGRRYRIVYPLQGTLSLTPERLSFLLDDLPLAARLLAHYQGEPYAAEYLDGGRIRARRGRELMGEGHLLSGTTRERVLYYFGTGTSRIGPWTLKGAALLEVRYWPTGGGLAYRARIVSAPGNTVANAVMNLGLFKNALRRRVRDVLTDIAQASAKLEKDGGRTALEKAALSATEKAKVEAFLHLP